MLNNSFFLEYLNLSWVFEPASDFPSGHRIWDPGNLVGWSWNTVSIKVFFGYILFILISWLRENFSLLYLSNIIHRQVMRIKKNINISTSQISKYQVHSTDNNLSLDSDDDFRSGCWNVSHHYRQQSFSGLHSPGRSNYTIRGLLVVKIPNSPY